MEENIIELKKHLEDCMLITKDGKVIKKLRLMQEILRSMEG